MNKPANTPRTRKVAAQRIDAAHQFDMSGIAAAVAGAQTVDYTQIPVLPPSGAMGRDGRGPFTYDIDTVVANVAANGADIPVFIDHQTGKALGWLSHKAKPIPMLDGSWDWPLYYTEEGMSLLRSDAYRYNSPTWLFIQDPSIQDRQAGQIVGILEVSLTNLPNQYLRSLNASENSRAYTVEIPTETDPMNKEQLHALGLAEDATPEQVMTAITSLSAAAIKAAEITTAAGAPAEADVAAVVEAAANSRVTSGVLVTKQAFDEVVIARDAAVTALDTFKAEQSQQAAVAAVDASIADGKFTPAMREDLIEVALAQGAVKFAAMANKASKHPASQNMQSPAGTGATSATDAAADYATSALGIPAATYLAGKSA